MPYVSRRGISPALYFGPLPKGVKWLLIINISLFIVQFLAGLVGISDIFDGLALWPRAVLTFPALWQLVTYMFLHGGISHILFNMFALWMFGTDLERDWGTTHFLRYYFLCGIGAGVCVVLASRVFGGMDIPTIGSSGAIFGLLLAFGVLYPERIILFSFLFPIQAKYFVMIIGAITFLSSLAGSRSGVSHVAHLGGMIFGYIYLTKGCMRFSLRESLQRAYHSWRIGRARKKFQVYIRKHNSKGNPWVN
jgi:membrane associated rhomboid family serine protease